MIWLTWRQMRTSAVAAAAALAGLALLLLVNGQAMTGAYGSDLAQCGPGNRPCADQLFNDYETPFLILTLLVLVVPALVGLFWGAPLVARELEAGTHRLVWSQSVTRTRWLATKLALTGLAGMAVAGLTSLVVGRWASPLDSANGGRFPRFDPLMFAGRGIVPVAYAAFAFVLGVTVGTLVRRALPAMAVTLAAFVVVQVVVPTSIRPHYQSPVVDTVEAAGSSTGLRWTPEGDGIELNVDRDALGDSGAWVLSSHTVDADGQRVDTIPTAGLVDCDLPGPEPERELVSGPGVQPAPTPGPDLSGCLREIAALGYRQEVTYFPFSRYWTFQWIESGLYLALSALLAAACFWALRRRLT